MEATSGCATTTRGGQYDVFGAHHPYVQYLCFVVSYQRQESRWTMKEEE